MIESLFIIALLIFSNYTDKTLPSKINNIVINDIFIKQLIVLALIYYSIKQWGEEQNHNFPEKIKLSFVLWISYLIVIKCRIEIISICIFLLFCIFFINDIKLYIENHPEDFNVDTKEYYLSIINNSYQVLMGSIGLVVIYGIITSDYKFKHKQLLYNLMDRHR